MKTTAALLLLIFMAQIKKTAAQPYVDPLSIRFTRAFKGNPTHATPYNHLYIGSDIPLKTKSGTIFLLSPFLENWNIDSAGNNNFLPAVSSVAFPAGIIFSVSDKWTLNLIAIPRINGESIRFDNFQMGGLTFVSYKVKEAKLRLGIYINNDFFGLFVIPLAGIDWKINENNYVFGLLPGRLTFEHRLKRNLFAGATFRAITNSYRFDDGRYLRIDDNQLSAYLDYYAVKNIAITLEPGYGIFRKLRTGMEHTKSYITDYDWNDGMFIKLSANYRIRL